MGQFSLLDLARAVLRQTGPGELTVSTWSTGIRDAENAAFLLSKGELTGFRMLTDRSFPGRHPGYCERIEQMFGSGSIRVTRTHAKFAMIKAGNWRIVIRSSMNLNRNKRWEQFDLDDDPELYDFFERFVTRVWEITPAGFDVSSDTRLVDTIMEKVLRGEVRIRAMTVAEYAAHRGVSVQAVNKAAREGRITKRDDGLIDRDAADADWARNSRSRKPTKAPQEDRFTADDGADPEDQDDSMFAVRLKKERAQAELAELKAAELKGRLVDLEEVGATWSAVLRTLRDRLLGIPDRLATLAASESDAHEVRLMIDREIRDALESAPEDPPA